MLQMLLNLLGRHFTKVLHMVIYGFLNQLTELIYVYCGLPMTRVMLIVKMPYKPYSSNDVTRNRRCTSMPHHLKILQVCLTRIQQQRVLPANGF